MALFCDALALLKALQYKEAAYHSASCEVVPSFCGTFNKYIIVETGAIFGFHCFAALKIAPFGVGLFLRPYGGKCPWFKQFPTLLHLICHPIHGLGASLGMH